MKKYTEEQLEAAFEFCRTVNERGGFRLSVEGGGGGEEDMYYEFPDLTCLLNSPDGCEHLPLPPKKVMMQSWVRDDGRSMLQEQDYLGFGYSWSKVGEPFEVTYPKESKQ